MPTEAEHAARIQKLDWEGLRSLWEAILQGDTPEWEEGRAFEYLVLRAFQLDRARVRWPYRVTIGGETMEQIDGAVHWRTLSCLVESKDYGKEPVNIEPIAKLRNQLLRRPAGMLGLVFSRSGFTNPARFLAQFNAPQVILLWNDQEVQFILERRRAVPFLMEKYRALAETGAPDQDIRQRFVP